MTSAAAAKWSQDHRHVFISVSIPGASASQDPQYTLAAEGGIQLEVNGRAFEQQLCGPIDPEHPNTSVTYKPNSVEICLRKAEKGYWSGLLPGGKKVRIASRAPG